MTPYTSRYVPEEEILLFETISSVVKNMKDVDLGLDEQGNAILLSCHILARAISAVFGLECVDGYFSVGYQHSWLKTKTGHVIDVYPVGIIGGPIFCVVAGLSPHRKLYSPKPTSEISGGKFESISFQRSIKEVVNEVLVSSRELLSKK